LIPILRAGIGMIDGILKLIPSARVGHIGIYRDHNTLEPVTYYFKIPTDCKHREVILLDPMIATGGSAIAAVEKLKGIGVRKIKFMCLVAAPEGVENFSKICPDVMIFAAALDN